MRPVVRRIYSAASSHKVCPSISGNSSTSRTSAVLAATSVWVRRQGQHLTATPYSLFRPISLSTRPCTTKSPIDPYKDFDPVTIAVSAPLVLAVHPSLPVQTVRDLVGFIKSSPGKYNFASPGTGTPGHL